MHSFTITRIGLIQKVRQRYPMTGQRRACEASGATQIIELSGKKGYSLPDVWIGSRPEVEYVCEWLFLIAPTRGQIDTRRAALLRFIDEATSRGSVVVEAGSGRRTDDAKQRSLMLAEAMAAIARKRQPGSGRKPGRRPQGQEGDDEKVRAIWLNLRDYPTYAAAEAAFPKGWGNWQKALNKFLPRGRLAKPKRKT